jgi:hypothetical protein
VEAGRFVVDPHLVPDVPVEVLHGHALVAGEGTGVGGEEEADAIVVGWTSGSLGVGGEVVGAIGVGLRG